jgi:hypothetical protein
LVTNELISRILNILLRICHKKCKMTRKSPTTESVPEKRIQVSPSKSFDLPATFWDE